ncbi:MAG: hypothetical protein NXI32_05515 [bacterium]|nr:hypothetical protein [bacterium]
MNASEETSVAETSQRSVVPAWFWGVTVVALLWNLMGLAAFVAQVTMTDEAIAALPEEQQGLYQNIPMWVNIAFACAVIGGTLGCIGLLARKRWALPLFVISLVGVLAQMFYSFFMTDLMEILGPSSAIMPSLVIVIAIFLVGFTRTAIQRSWLP